MQMLLLALGFVFLAAGGAIIFYVVRTRRRLEALGRQHRMHPPSGDELELVLRSAPERWANSRLRQVLVGSDGSGRFIAARKGWGPEMRDIFLLELNRHSPARGLSLQSRNSEAGALLRIQWDVTPTLALDSPSREVMQRVLREFAAFKIQHPKRHISLEIGERGALLHAPAGGEEVRAAFIASARVLRGDLMHCLYRRDRSSGPTSAVKGAAEEDSKAQAELPAQTPGKEEVHPDIEQALDNLEAQPLISAEELLAEKRAAPPKGWSRVRGKDIFQIPEPEDRVVVIEASAAHTKAIKPIKSDEKDKSKFFLP